MNLDGIGDVPYYFPGNNDPLPYISPPILLVWAETPTDQYIEYGSLLHYDLNIAPEVPVIWGFETTLF